MPLTRDGAKLRAARLQAGLSQAALAEMMGIAPRDLALIENGRRTMTVELRTAADRALPGWGMPAR